MANVALSIPLSPRHQGISRRAFNRLIQNQFNINNCKPSTKENLIKLKTFFNDPEAINRYLRRAQSIPILPTGSQQLPKAVARNQVPPSATNNDNSFYSTSEMNTDVEITSQLYNDIADRTKIFMRDYKVTNSQLGAQLSRRLFFSL